MSCSPPTGMFMLRDAELPFKDMLALFSVGWAVGAPTQAVLFLIIPCVYGEMHASWQIGLALIM